VLVTELSVAVQPPEAAEMAAKPSTALLRKHLLGGSTTDMTMGHIVSPRDNFSSSKKFTTDGKTLQFCDLIVTSCLSFYIFYHV